MTKLEQLRVQINECDKQMALLFNKRLEIVKEITFEKKKNNLPIVDKNRENEVIKQNMNYVNTEYQKYYYSFIENIMNISKNYQGKNNENK